MIRPCIWQEVRSESGARQVRLAVEGVACWQISAQAARHASTGGNFIGRTRTWTRVRAKKGWELGSRDDQSSFMSYQAQTAATRHHSLTNCRCGQLQTIRDGAPREGRDA